jgi:hypothetical protein
MASGSLSTRRPSLCEGAGAARPLRTPLPYGSRLVRLLVLVLLSASLALALLVAPPAADAATRRATNSELRVRFTLENRVLTVRVLRGAPRRVRRQLYGHQIRAVCGTDFDFRQGVQVRRTRLWPQGRRRVRFGFSRNISRRAKWCLVERRSGDDVAFVSFSG